MDQPPPDDRDQKPAFGPEKDPDVRDFASFLTAGGTISVVEWHGMSPKTRAALTYAGTLVARMRAAMLAEEIVALAAPPPEDPVEAAIARSAALAIKAGGA